MDQKSYECMIASRPRSSETVRELTKASQRRLEDEAHLILGPLLHTIRAPVKEAAMAVCSSPGALKSSSLIKTVLDRGSLIGILKLQAPQS